MKDVSDLAPPPPEQHGAAGSVWTRPDRGARGPMPEHSRAEIAVAAIALADSGGLAAASMRAVAGALGTTAGSLYRYLSSRDELLDLMVDLVLGELQLRREPAGNWVDDLVALAEDQLALHRRHPWLLEVSLSGSAFGPNATDYFEYCLRIMAPLERATDAKMEAIAMITGVVTLFVRGKPAQHRQVAPTSIFAAASVERHPYLLAALTRPGQAAPRPDMFQRTIRSVLRGLLVDED
jgi:AcrR family transcriptional regulator